MNSDLPPLTSGPSLPSLPSAQPKNSALAIASLVLGILSLTCLWLLSAVPAVICGHLAYSRIKRSDGALEGTGLALAGLITGYISIAISLIMIPLLAAIAIPNFVKARAAAQANACRSNLRQIDDAKQAWAVENKKESSDVPTVADLSAFLNRGAGTFICPAGGTYSINEVDASPTCTVPRHTLDEF